MPDLDDVRVILLAAAFIAVISLVVGSPLLPHWLLLFIAVMAIVCFVGAIFCSIYSGFFKTRP